MCGDDGRGDEVGTFIVGAGAIHTAPRTPYYEMETRTA
jgi:hypothetical protein